MLNVTQTVKNLLNSSARQGIKISFSGDEKLVIRESDIVFGSFSLDRYSVSNNKIELGSFPAAQVSFKLKNDEDKWNDIKFEGAEIYIELIFSDGNTIPLGYYIIDNQPRKLSTISITALDRRVKFDNRKGMDSLSFPMSVSNLVSRACANCGVQLTSSLSKLPNANYSITENVLGQDDTWTAVIQWCAAIMGTCAFLNTYGNVEFKWYTATNEVIGPSDRYTHDLEENDITITGVKFESDDKIYLNGTDDYCFDLSDNPLITSNIDEVLTSLGKVLTGFIYRVYSATVKPKPYLFPMDMITFTDKDGINHETIVTNVKFKLNGNTVIAGKGQSEQRNGYASRGNATKEQAEIIRKLRQTIEEKISETESSIIDFNRLIGNSLGLNLIAVEQENGSNVYYFCDGDTLEGSTIIYTFNANGFASTTDWNNGNPIWEYGRTRDGSIIARYLNVLEISADQIRTGRLESKDGSTFIDLDTGEVKIGGITATESAYDIAVRNGFQGTEEEWLASLRGENGSKGDDAITLYIDSTNGTQFKNTEVTTTLMVAIYYGDKKIENSEQLKNILGESAYLQWSEKKIGQTVFSDLPKNDSKLSDDGFVLTITPQDINSKSVFNCDLYIE